MKTIAAELWTLEVIQGSMDYIHGNYIEILEVYVPEYNIAFNLCQGNMSAFVVSSGRYSPDNVTAKKIKNITLPEKLVNDLKTYADLRTSLQKDAEEFFEQYKDRE
jgi:hypothetical protein